MKRLIHFILVLTLYLGNGLVYAQGSGTTSDGGNPLRGFLSASGKLIPDIESNSILVVDYGANIEMIKQYLVMADVPAQQVVIEARVVEVKLEGEHSLGINWEILHSRALGTGQMTPYSGARGTLPRQQIDFKAPRWEPLSFSGNEETPFSFGLFNENIDIIVQVLSTILDTKILSAPKITAINNRRAKIDVTKTTPFVSEISVDTETTDAGIITTIEYTYEYADEGVSLAVTPLINPDGTITLELFPQVKEILRFKPMPGYAGALVELPETDVRVAQTKVTLREGETLVIGGLIRDKKIEGELKVPILGDLPFLGNFFKTKKTDIDKTELMIFVSAKIVDSGFVKKMKLEEENHYGKWYMDKRKAYEKELARLENKKLFPSVSGLSEEVKSLTSDRKDLEQSLGKIRREMEALNR